MSTKIEMFNHYHEAVDWINSLISFGIKPGLKRMEMIMEMLNHPQRRLKFIHVGGTNGKGSACSFLAKALVQGGYNVGTFTSPYMEKFTDRIQYNDKTISEHEVLYIANLLKPIAAEIAMTELGSPTMFEIVTALAIYYYAKIQVPDFVVFEVGLGGRLDSTNIIAPVVSVITNVGHDHMDILGDSLTQVVSEKAGIIKPGVPIVSAVNQPETIQVIRKTAAEKKSTLYLLDEEFSITPVSQQLDEQVFDFQCSFRTIKNVTITMNGYHQVKNAAVALMTLEVLRQYVAVIIEDEDVYKAFRETQWPGRLEMIQNKPRLLLDGAHNPEGASALANAVSQIYAYQKLHLMMGMLSNKNHTGYLRHILPLVDTLIITEPDFHKKLVAGKLAEEVDMVLREMNHSVNVIIEPNWKNALHDLLQVTNKEDLAIVTGTLYLISDVRSWMLYQSDSEKGW